MSFAAPGFLLGLLLLALPLWLHRLRTASNQSEPFASVRLLEAAAQRVHVARRIRFWVLLLLRLALLALAALAFAQPLLKGKAAVAGEPAHWLVIDVSASMARPALAQAQAAAVDAALAAVPPGVPVGVVAAAERARIVSAPTTARAQVRQVAAELPATPSRVDFGALVEQLPDLLQATDGTPAVAYLISDLQATAMPDRFSRVVPPRALTLALYPVRGSDRNTSIASATVDASELVVTLAGDTAGAQVQVLVGGGAAATLDYAGGGSTRRAELDLLPEENRIELMLGDSDGLTLDNRYFLLEDQSPPEQVPLLTSRGDATPYLVSALRAIDPDAAFAPEPLLDFDPRRLSRYRWLAVEDLGALDDRQAQAFASYLENGGRLLAGAADDSVSRSQLPVTEQTVGELPLTPEYQLGGVAADHPILADLDLPDLLVSRALNIQPGDDDVPLVWLADGRPLLLIHQRGAGQAIVLNGGFGREWHDWPLQEGFVPLLGAMVEQLSGRARFEEQAFVGQLLSLPADGEISYELLPPDGDSLFGMALGSTGVTLSQVGFHSVHGSDGSLRTVAVNVPPVESDLTPLAPDVLAQWEASLAGSVAPDPLVTATVGNEPAPDRRLVPLLLALLVLAALVESAAGNLMMRKPV
ncbi:MAG: BatA domain-containing protein [Pseudomonadota bacterium]